ncbi:MAG: glycosyltransferase family 4 protein [Ferruginibacter sp.]
MPAALESGSEYILFFGRISAYKGLGLLLEAMQQVWEQYPHEKLLIAGGGADDALLAHPLLTGKDERVIFHNRFIPAEELSAIISRAKFVVCPYTDATQSGVLVSSFALNKPVLATNVGAFSEQLEDSVTGKLIPSATVGAVADTILYALKDERYKQWEQQLREEAKQNKWELNGQQLMLAYNN